MNRLVILLTVALVVMLVVILILGFLVTVSGRTTTVYSTKYPENIITLTKQVFVEQVAQGTVYVIGTCTESPGTISANYSAVSTQYIFQTQNSGTASSSSVQTNQFLNVTVATVTVSVSGGITSTNFKTISVNSTTTSCPGSV